MTSPRSLAVHALALAGVLAAVAVLVGTDSAFVTDESYAVIQLDHLEATGEWALPHPLPEVDPDGAAFPLHGATQYDSGFTLYGKHPGLIYLYRPVHQALGLAGLVAVSVAGTVMASLLAALMAERFRRGSGPLALWLVGVASPLFFDAFVIHAHTIAAATAAAAAWCALRATEDRRAGWGAGAVVAALATALLRTEGVLFAAALGATVIGVGLLRRTFWIAALGATIGAAGAAAMLIDRAWATAVAGGAYIGSVPHSSNDTGWLEGRVSSLSYTLVMPGYRGLTAAEALTAVGALLLMVGVVLVHRRRDDAGALVVPAVGGALLLGRSALEWGPVPGILLAACVIVAGLLVADRALLGRPAVRVVLATAAVFGFAVAVSQYASGGHTEWGGRYFALAVPLLGAVAAPSLLQAWATWEPRRARVVQGAMAGAALGLAVLAVSTLIASHERNRERTDGVLAAAAEIGPASDGGRPIVVTEDDQVPRLARGRYEEVRFLLVRSGTIEGYLTRLADEGIEDLLIVSTDPARTLERLGPYVAAGDPTPHQLQYDEGGGLIHVTLRPEDR